jgi:hypothetical protein
LAQRGSDVRLMDHPLQAAMQRVSICSLAKYAPEPPPGGIGADLWGV